MSEFHRFTSMRATPPSEGKSKAPKLDRALFLVEVDGALLLPRVGSKRALDLNTNLVDALAWICKEGLKKRVQDVVLIGADDTSKIAPEKRASAWAAVKDPQSGRSFYANKFTKSTTWTSPFELQTSDWVEHSDKEGNKFYVNKSDHTSSWDRPKDFNKMASRAPGAATELLKIRGVHTMDLPGTDGKDILESLEAAVKAMSSKNAEKLTSVFLICKSTNDIAMIKNFFHKDIASKYKNVDSLTVIPIKSKRKIKAYVQTLMGSVIQVRPFPEENDLVSWDLADNKMYKGAKISSKWQNEVRYEADAEGSTTRMKHSIHKYKILNDSLGQGAFGKVYRSVCDDGSFMAVKVYQKEEIEKQDMSFAVSKELGIMCKLNRPVGIDEDKDEPGHPNVLSIRELYESEKDMYVIMEIAEGGAFFDRVNKQLANKGPFKESSARPYFIQLIQGLAYMHESKYVHRDLKPENMLLGGPHNDVIKICDFGLSTWVKEDSKLGEGEDESKYYEASSPGVDQKTKRKSAWGIATLFGSKKPNIGKARKLSSTGSMSDKEFKMLQSRVGTPHYVAPEVLTGLGYDGFQADVWSTGVILYIMLVGTFPFDKAIIEDFIGYIRECHPYDVSAIFQVDSEMLDPLTKNAQDLILQMLNTDPKKRITLGEVMAHPWVRAGGTIRKEGYLEKNRRMFNKKYWCTLGKGEFRYYTDKSMKALHHAIHIGECKLLVGKGSDLSIILIDRHDDAKEYKFLASDAEDRDSWATAFSEEALGGRNRNRSNAEKGGDTMGASQMEFLLEEANRLYKAGLIDKATCDSMRERAMELVAAPSMG